MYGLFKEENMKPEGVVIVPVKTISRETREKIAQDAKICFSPGKGSAFVGLSRDEYKELIDADSDMREFHVLLTDRTRKLGLSFCGIFQLVWKDDTVELDGLHVDKLFRKEGKGALLLLAAMYMAASAQRNRLYRAKLLELNVLATGDVESLIKFYQSYGAELCGENIYHQDGEDYLTYLLTIDLERLRKHEKYFRILESYIKGYVSD